MKNKRGQLSIFVSLMVGVVLFWLGMTLEPPISQVVQDARGDTQLNCSSAVTYQEKANCTFIDTIPSLMVGTVLGIAGFILTRNL